MVVLHDFHFRLLESLLDHIKASGCEDDVLAIDGNFISSLSLGIEGPVASAIKILRSLKDLDKALHVLWKAVENGLSMAQKKLLPIIRHHGILSLPLEIVAQIFRQVHDDDANCATRSIPLVNHYFRDIAVRTPELWTRLTTYMNPRLFIERSKPLGLEVKLVQDPHYIRFIDLVAPEAERWTSLSCYTNVDVENAEWTRNILAGKTLAALRELHIQGDDIYYQSLDDSSFLYSNWKMPSLRIIKSTNTLPSIQPASLTCFHLHFDNEDSSPCEDMCLDGITTFLQSVPLLTELLLDIGWFRIVTFYTETETTLPNVKTLLLRVKSRGDTDSHLTDFLTSLHMPSLSDLSVDVTTFRASLLTRWISVIFPKGNSFWPSLETLDLSMSYGFLDYDSSDDYERDGYGTSAPNDLMERLPAARHLSIRAVDVDPPPYFCWNVQLPHLRTLCFRDCNKFDVWFIRSMHTIFEAPDFETLKIHNCAMIATRREVLRKAMPEDKALVFTCLTGSQFIRLDDDITVL